MKTRVFTSLAVLSVVGVASAFQATVVTSPGITSNLNGPWTLGYSFKTNTALNVTALGAFAAPDVYTRSIGIWDSSGTLLMSASVDGSEAVVDFMNYTGSITTFTGSGTTLASGQIYVVGATANPGRGWAFNPTFSVDPAITYLQSRFASGGSLTNPTSNAGSSTYMGGSFQAEAVPEPATLAALGLGALAMLRRRRAA